MGGHRGGLVVWWTVSRVWEEVGVVLGSESRGEGSIIDSKTSCHWNKSW